MTRKLILTGGVLILPERFDQSRTLVSILLSIFFLTLLLVVKPHRRSEDEAIVVIAHVALVLVYIILLVLKTCTVSTEACGMYGFGREPTGIFVFFLIFGFSILLLLIFISVNFVNAARERAYSIRESSRFIQTKDLLALFANPQLSALQVRSLGLRPLSFGQDMKHLLRSMRESEIAIEPAATLDDAKQAISKYMPRILVFSGHTVMGTLAFEDTTGRLDEHASAESIGEIFYGTHEEKRGRAMSFDDSGSSTAGSANNLFSSCSDSPTRVARQFSDAPEVGSFRLSSEPDDDHAPASPVSSSPVGSPNPARRISSASTKIAKCISKGLRHSSAKKTTLPALERMECIILNGCKTESIGLHLLRIATHVTVVCWSTLAEHGAARAFASGFYESVHKMLQKERQRGTYPYPRSRPTSKRQVARKSGLNIENAFRAGCARFIKEGYMFGDPEDYFHAPGHPHTYRPDYANCPHCTPPVHGECLMLRYELGEINIAKASDIVKAQLEKPRGVLSRGNTMTSLKHFCRTMILEETSKESKSTSFARSTKVHSRSL